MKILVLLSMIFLTACASKPKESVSVKTDPVVTQPQPPASEPKKVSVMYNRNELRKSCWRGVKKACGHDFACYEKVGNYCEKTSTFRDIKN